MRNPNELNRGLFARARLAAVVAAVVLITPATAFAGDQIYSFVDEQGVEHFSNVPSDPRYKVIGWLKPQAGGSAQQQPLHPAAPAALPVPAFQEPDMSQAEEVPMSQFQEPPLAPQPGPVDPQEIEQQAHVPPVSAPVIDMQVDPASTPQRIGGDPAFAPPPEAERR